jgi:hypothetical protein
MILTSISLAAQGRLESRRNGRQECLRYGFGAAGWPSGRRRVCGLGNPRYGRLGSLRYAFAQESPAGGWRTGRPGWPAIGPRKRQRTAALRDASRPPAGAKARGASWRRRSSTAFGGVCCQIKANTPRPSVLLQGFTRFLPRFLNRPPAAFGAVLMGNPVCRMEPGFQPMAPSALGLLGGEPQQRYKTTPLVLAEEAEPHRRLQG